MARKQRSVEEIISKLREAEVALAQGETLGQACRRIGVSDHTFYRWRREYGGLKVDQAKRLRDMEGENALDLFHHAEIQNTPIKSSQSVRSI